MNSNESELLVSLFRQFIESVLLEHDTEKALSFMSDDVIGIGMGAQGIVSSKADAARIISSDKADTEQGTSSVSYIHTQVRCYDGLFGTVCGVIKISSSLNTATSTIGQIVNFRKENGRWLVYSLQATPIFEEIEELEAYPIKFAENLLEAYRQQEQIAHNAQSNNVAVYLVNYTKGIFENAVLMSEYVIPVKKGDSYEEVIFGQARNYLRREDHYNFISTFSLGNVLKAYQEGQKELSLDYEMILSTQMSLWMRTIIKLYADNNDNLMGYLYVVDIDKEKRRELELQKNAELDSMTKLYNKQYSEAKIAEKLKSVSPVNPSAFLMIDLDYFKRINDTYGHQEGDRIIQETARCILSLTNTEDICGRLGGDEFCIYFHDISSFGDIEKKARLLCDYIRSLISSKDTGISCSIGIVFCTDSKSSFSDVYHVADQALYQQKKNGRNGYTIYNNGSC